MFCFPSFLQRINLPPSICFLEKFLVCVCVSICLYTCVRLRVGVHTYVCVCVCECVCVCVCVDVSVFFMHTGCMYAHPSLNTHMYKISLGAYNSYNS